MTENEIMTSRPLTTELTVDTEDFDTWDIPSSQIITFALKEFKVSPPEKPSHPFFPLFSTATETLCSQV